MDYLKKVEKDLAPSDRLRSIRLRANQLRALPSQNLRRNIHHRWSGTGIFTLPNDKEDHTRESQQDYLCLQRQCGLCRRSGYRTVCSGRPPKPDYFQVKDIKSVISLKAETHNFPTTVEPFNGASTGTGGEIRDRMGGGKGSWPIAGTAVYMTSYPVRKKDVPGKRFCRYANGCIRLPNKY